MEDPEPPAAAAAASYARCRERGAFIAGFYQHLWRLSPEVAARFRGTDMARQHEVLRDGLNTLLMYARGSAVAGMALDRIATIHSRANNDVSPELYAMFVRALVETAAVWDAQWTPELEHSWRAALEPGIERMSTQR